MARHASATWALAASRATSAQRRRAVGEGSTIGGRRKMGASAPPSARVLHQVPACTCIGHEPQGVEVRRADQHLEASTPALQTSAGGPS